MHQQLDRLQANFGRLHTLALHEQSQFIFRCSQFFGLGVMKCSTQEPKTCSVNVAATTLPTVLAIDRDDNVCEELIPTVDDRQPGGCEIESQATLVSNDDFTVKLGHLCNLIFVICGKDSYDIFVKHGLRDIVKPILNAVRQIREHVELCEESEAAASMDYHQLHIKVMDLRQWHPGCFLDIMVLCVPDSYTENSWRSIGRYLPF